MDSVGFYGITTDSIPFLIVAKISIKRLLLQSSNSKDSTTLPVESTSLNTTKILSFKDMLNEFENKPGFTYRTLWFRYELS